MTTINPHGNHLAASSINAAKPAINSASAAAKAEKKAEIEAMAADFEAIFVRQMLSTMRTASLGEGLFDGKGTEEFRDMQDSQLAKSMAAKGVFGVADMLTRHLDKSSVPAKTTFHTGSGQSDREQR